MQKLTEKDLWPAPVYEKTRDEYRARIIALKAPRRVQLGDSVTLLFENRDTVKFQVQEMLRAEHLETPEGIQAELDVYNGLLPGEGELSATLMIDVTEEKEIPVMLNKLVGLEEALCLVFGAHEIAASFEQGRSDGARVSAVQFVRFPLGAARRDFGSASPVALELRHPAYRVRTALAPPTLASLRQDLGL